LITDIFWQHQAKIIELFCFALVFILVSIPLYWYLKLQSFVDAISLSNPTGCVPGLRKLFIFEIWVEHREGCGLLVAYTSWWYGFLHLCVL